MAEINPSIAMGYQPVQIQDPVNQFAKLQDLQMGAAKMQEYQRGLEEQNALRNLIKSGVDIKSPEARQKMYEISPKLGMEFEKSQAEINRLGNEAKLKQFEVQREKFANLVFNPSNENVLAHLQDSVKNGELGADQAKGLWSKVAGLNEVQRKKFFTDMGVKAEQRLASETTRRGQDLTYAAATQPVFSETAGGFYTRPTGGKESTFIPAGGVEQTTKGREKTKAQGDVGDITSTMAASYTKLRDAGAMKSVEAGAGSNLAAGLQSSAVGQFLGGTFGTTEQSERDYVTSQRRLLVQAIAKATGMTASQMNSDKELQSMLDSATDTKKGYETNIRTLNDINRRYGTGAPITIAPPAGENAPAAPAAASTDRSPTKANAAKLLPPVNAQGWQLHIDKNGNRAYVGPNGQIQEVK